MEDKDIQVGMKFISKTGNYEVIIVEVLTRGVVIQFQDKSKDFYKFDEFENDFKIKKIFLKEKLQNYLDQNKIEDMERLFNQACKDLDSYDKGYYKAKWEMSSHLKQILENDN